MEVEDPKPDQYDYASLYEEWHLQQTKATKNDDINYTQALAARAGEMGTLHCALRNKSSTENSGFLQALLERIELQGDPGRSAIPLPDYVVQQQQQQQQRPPQQPVHVSIDSFFEEYPECVRPNWDAIGDDDSSSDDESSDEMGREENSQPSKKKPLSKDVSLQAQFPEEEKAAPPSCILYPSQNSYQKESSTNPPNFNDNGQFSRFNPNAMHSNQPYNKKSHPPVAGRNGGENYRNSHNNYPNNRYNNQGWDNDTYQRNNRGWDDNPRDNNNNPFQTARQYANAMGDQGAAAPQQQQRQAAQNTNIYNPYCKKPQEEEEEPVLAQGPVIPESLKRKFQPPKRGVAPSKTSSNNKDKSKTVSTTNDNRSKSSSTTGDEDDEDLPEELKKHGKELVEKIRSEIMDNGEQITFDDIAGLEDAKCTIQEIVCWPMKRPELFTGLRKVPNGLLLFGPPGTGKTLIGKAIAHASGATFFSISSSALTSKWMGEGEKLVRTLFAVAAHHEPSCIFLDEVDSLLTQRKSDDSEASRRIKTEFLVQLDGSSTNSQGRVLVIGATNRPQELDEAARRRFIKRLYIPLPTESDRACLLRVLLAKNEHTLVPKEVEKLARETRGFSGADLKALSADAAMGPIRQLGPKAMDVDVNDLPPITYKHFRQSLRGMHPSVSPEDITQYEIFDKTYGSKRASEIQEDDGDESDSDDSGSTPSP